jgi:hypothetical protein
MTNEELDRMASALGLDSRLDAARNFAASLAQDLEESNRANSRLCALLRDCHAVIWAGCASEEARPCRSDLILLLRRIEQSLPDLKQPLEGRD